MPGRCGLRGPAMTMQQGMNKPKIYLVQPKFPPSYWGMEHFIALTPYGAVYPPLGLLTLAGLTPREFPIALCDENAGEEVNYDTDAEIVCITGYIIQIQRVFEIADRFAPRARRSFWAGRWRTCFLRSAGLTAMCSSRARPSTPGRSSSAITPRARPPTITSSTRRSTCPIRPRPGSMS